jgi:DNA-binding transcriptional MerR regulator
VADRSHLSIGEVLSLLQAEFPDVTISKIRFLESQGLVDPERTPSGYRKFYEGDIERLRWVLRQQRDSFLPLKVIKGRLRQVPDDDEYDGTGADDQDGEEVPPPPAGGQGAGEDFLSRLRSAGTAEGEAAGTGLAPARRAPATWRRSVGPQVTGEAGPGASGQLFDTGPHFGGYAGGGRPHQRPQHPAHEEAVAPAAEGAAQPAATAARPDGPGRRRATPAPRAAAPVHKHARTAAARRTETVVSTGEDHLVLDELVRAAGVEVETVRDLERYGLINARVIGGTAYYGPEAAVIASLAGAFARHGVEARHLRAYKSAAEREAGMVQQVIMPLIKQRNPQARRAAGEAAEELSQLGGELRAALLRSALAELR